MLSQLTNLERFKQGNKSEQAELIVWYLYEASGRSEGIEARSVEEGFNELHLPQANRTRLKAHFKKSRNVRKVANDKYTPTLSFMDELEGLVEFDQDVEEDVLDVRSIPIPPFVDEQRQQHLSKMVRVYAHLFLLENSMRGLIESVLSKHLGEDWWEIASNAQMKNKHSNRIDNEQSKKWAPTRSDFGPLYALDWPDLITLMRKYPDQFNPHIGEINFLHRFEDAGSFRNVVAHNGVLSEQDDFDLIRIYYQNWVKQLSDQSLTS